MPVDQGLNTRMRDALAARTGISEKQMMGGQCFFLNGNMLGGARRHNDGVGWFMFRVGKEREALALLDPTAHEVIHGPRKLGGFIRVEAETCDDAALGRWMQMCIDHAQTLPAKP